MMGPHDERPAPAFGVYRHGPDGGFVRTGDGALWWGPRAAAAEFARLLAADGLGALEARPFPELPPVDEARPPKTLRDLERCHDRPPPGYRKRTFSGTDRDGVFDDPHDGRCYRLSFAHDANMTCEVFLTAVWLCVDDCPASKCEVLDES